MCSKPYCVMSCGLGLNAFHNAIHMIQMGCMYRHRKDELIPETNMINVSISGGLIQVLTEK